MVTTELTQTTELAQTKELAQTLMPAIFARLLAQQIAAGDSLLAGTGLVSAGLKSASHITLQQHLRILENCAALSKDPAWALRFGSRISLNTLGPPGMAAINAPTLGQGIDIWHKYLGLRAPAIDIAARAAGNHLHVTCSTGLSLGPLEPVIMEMVFQVAQTYLQIFTESPIGDAALRLRYRPPHYAHHYRDWFHCALTFNAENNELIIPAAWSSLANPLHDAPLWQTSLAECEALLSSRAAEDSTPHTVRRLLTEALDRQLDGAGGERPIPSAAQVAEHLHITSRTLIRRLKRAQTSYQALRDEVVKQRALYLLTETRLPIADIGARVGYSDPANFGRGCRRWFGLSPGAVRRRAHHIKSSGIL